MAKSLVEYMKDAANEAADMLKVEIDANTPEDTRSLIGNNRIKRAELQGSIIESDVHNDTPYAIYVEM